MANGQPRDTGASRAVIGQAGYNGSIPCRSPGRPPSAVARTSPSANRSRIRAPGFTPAAWVMGAPAGSVTNA